VWDPIRGRGPRDDRLDPDLLAAGDRRNVVDRYRYWRMDAIVSDLDERRFEFHVAIENLRHDMNIGSIVRTANAFLAAEVHVVGRRRWNRRGAMVTDRYQHIRHHEDATALGDFAHEAGLAVIGLDNVPGSTSLERAELPQRCVLFFGQEGSGLSPDALSVCDRTLAITQFGSTRSINVGAAAAIAMHTWIRQHAV
jgi:tRNA G18 (ribose-2'-O)-methylase SpoU